jgi:hypothetical protein
MHGMKKCAEWHIHEMLHNVLIFEYAVYVSCMYTIIYISITECAGYYSCLETM